MCAGSVRTSPRTWLSWHGRSMTWQAKLTRSAPPEPHPAPPSAQPRPRQAPPSTPGRRYCLSLNFLHSFKEIYLVAKVLVLNKFCHYFSLSLAGRESFWRKSKLQKDSPCSSHQSRRGQWQTSGASSPGPGQPGPSGGPAQTYLEPGWGETGMNLLTLMYLILNMFVERIQHTSGCVVYLCYMCVFVAPVENILLSIAWWYENRYDVIKFNYLCVFYWLDVVCLTTYWLTRSCWFLFCRRC